MNYNVLQCAITKDKQEEFPDGIITKVGNDKYTLDEAVIKWHSQCGALRNDANTLCYTCMVVDSQLDKVGEYKEFYDKRLNPTVQSTPADTSSEPSA